ncbi:hypothetical protein ACP4OV_027946 [Aristida adscensionis]
MHLDLPGCSCISKLPESFGDLKSLIHLDMSCCSGIIELPGTFGNLTSLQHLLLSRCQGLKALPESFCGLKNLQYLDISSCRYLQRLPEAIGSLADLQYLKMSSCDHITELPGSFKLLRNLEHLDLSFTCCMRGLPGALRGLTTLQHLDISNCCYGSINLIYHEDISDALGSLINLKYLNLNMTIDQLFGTTSERRNLYLDFIGVLTNIEHLVLSWNSGLEYLPESVGNLESLRTLDLSNCRNLKSLPQSIGALSLKSLLMEGCSRGLIEQANSMLHYSLTLPLFNVRPDDVSGGSNLHKLEGVDTTDLKIHFLENVRSLDEADRIKLLDKQSLLRLTLSWTLGADRFLEDKDLLEQLVPPRGLENLILEGYGSRSFPSWIMGLSHYLPNLVHICLCDQPTCSNLPPLGQLPNLRTLSLMDLPSITKIDRDFCGGNGAFRRLSGLWIGSMERLEEWNTTYSGTRGVEEFVFPVLDTLEISECPRLRIKPRPPVFRECTIERSDKVVSSLGELETSCHVPSTRSTKLVVSESKSQSLRLFHHFPALRELKIDDFPNLTSWPEGMRRLTSLQSLELGFCGSTISALPEWLGELSSLRSLTIWGCDSIESLPPCIQRLTKLQRLEIGNNSELKQWCESNENEKMLAHISDKVYENCD